MNTWLGRAYAVSDALRSLADPATPEGTTLRTEALRECGLSAPMIDWALTTTMAGLPTDFEVLVRNANVDGASFVRRAALILSGNVLTAPAEPLAIHAIANVPTRVKVSSSGGSFARAFLGALDRTSPEMRSLFTLHAFGREDRDSLTSLVEGAEVVTAYGGDLAMRDISASLSKSTRFIEYGHGFGALVLDVSSADDALVHGAALDVAAYDQRGCRSPQVVFAMGTRPERESFARRLSDALGEVERRLPRGPLSDEALGHERRWRQSMIAVGELYESPTAAVAAVDADTPITTPLHRNIQVHPLSAMENFADFAARAGKHLKVVGVAQEHISALDHDASRAFVGGSPHPELTAVGAMQRPRMHDYGLLRALVGSPK